jgi:predicted AlkP superfamily phosphohydrolase/phosphomutase
VLAIGLDAAEVSLIEPWMDDGTLPNLARLRSRGAYGRLRSTADWVVGSPWPSFYTSSWPSDHGFVNYLQWLPQRMSHERPNDSWLPLRPFWRELPAQRLATVVIDIPVTYSPGAHGGVELNSWASHDKLWPASASPAGLLTEVYREFGHQPIRAEITGLQRAAELLRLRDELVESAGRVADLTLAFLERYPWDLAMVVLGATHRGGHKLWDDSGTVAPPSPTERAELDAALRSVYRSCDQAIGRLLDAAPADAQILVFALHGMGPNDSRHALLPEMLELILAEGSAPPAALGSARRLLQRSRQAVPLEWRSGFKRRLPQVVQDRLAVFWRNEGTEWSSTRAFTTIGDKEGHIRVNLKGREALGAVDPSEYDGLLALITKGLLRFVDEDTGAPVVADVARAAELWPPGDRAGQLGDLIVRWSDSPARAHRALISPGHGRLPWPTPGKNPDGRSGHHRGTGWLLAAGPAVRPGALIHDGHILDLAPTILAQLGARPPYAMRGRSLTFG